MAWWGRLIGEECRENAEIVDMCALLVLSEMQIPSRIEVCP